MHELLWIPLDWTWWGLLIGLAIAVVIGIVVNMLSHNRWSLIGPLAVCYVLYQGISWDLWWWVPGIFWAAWWIGLISAIVCLWRSVLFEFVARVATAVVVFIVAVLVLWQAILVPLWEHVGESIWDSVTSSDHNDATTGEPSGTTSGSTTFPPSTPTSTRPCWTLHGQSYCAWPMADEMPDSDVWFTVPSIENAQTSAETQHAFKFGWYDQALKSAPLLSQLDGIVTGNEVPVSKLYSDGWSTRRAQVEGDAISRLLSDASYAHDGSTIKVVLPNGEDFWVSGDTGRLSETRP